MLSTKIFIEEIEIRLEISKHAEERSNERELTQYEIYSMIMKMGEQLLELKDGEEFAVVDRELNNAVICSMNCRGIDLVVDIITVISNEHVWISRGTKVYKVSDINSFSTK